MEGLQLKFQITITPMGTDGYAVSIYRMCRADNKSGSELRALGLIGQFDPVKSCFQFCDGSTEVLTEQIECWGYLPINAKAMLVAFETLVGLEIAQLVAV